MSMAPHRTEIIDGLFLVIGAMLVLASAYLSLR